MELSETQPALSSLFNLARFVRKEMKFMGFSPRVSVLVGTPVVASIHPLPSKSSFTVSSLSKGLGTDIEGLENRESSLDLENGELLCVFISALHIPPEKTKTLQAVSIIYVNWRSTRAITAPGKLNPPYLDT
ncbi:hypothetical protein SADUNF_Sadunf13G0075500 [Salix dunnii]|uniref:Uncharacterized protein n=1 Tax=Salix dunnii TaxID=1413687 RepID=A0A835JGX5_9ROSI|nr:hypothetical protein SADUNF_Sadunf13G0075500 [Salix dunnii]